MRCLEFMKVTEILRLSEMHAFTYREIAESVGCSKTTVGEVLKRCQEHNLTYNDVKSMTQDKINELIYPESFGRKQTKTEPDWDYIHARLQSSKRINMQYIWEEEYRPNNPNGYSYSRFCAKYVQWKRSTGKKVVLPQEREPGKELFIDWIGDTLPCVVDRSTGEIHDAHFFVTTLGDGSYPFVEAFPNETQLFWNQGHIDALEWYGGCPKVFVPDNCKTAVIHTSLYNPDINHAYRELARHYGVAIIPARILKPKDKATVESSVGWLETWLIEWLKGKTYFSFESLNHDIFNRVTDLAERPFKHRKGSRKSIFETLDKPALRSLPKDHFESFTTKLIKRVPNNYHVEYNGFYYSVPYQYYDQSVVMHIYARWIEIYDNDGSRIAYHQRAFSGKRYITDAAHMPANHRAVVEMRSRDGSFYRSWSSSIGPNTNQVITLLLEKADFEEQAYKSCMGVIGFAKTYGNSRVEKACKKAITLNSVTYTTVRNILKNNQDFLAEEEKSSADTPTPYHENLRTGEWK